MKKSTGKPFAITSAIIAAVGALPLLVYLYKCLEYSDSQNSYFSSGGNPLLIFFMGVIGFISHCFGLASGMTGFGLGSKAFSVPSMIANVLILGVISIVGFFTLS